MVTSRANTSPVSQSTAGSANFSTRNAASQGAYDPIGADGRVMRSGDESQIQDRVRSIFENREVDLAQGAEPGESPEQRIARIAQQITSGERDFGNVRQSVDRLAGSANYTLGSAGLPTVEQPTLRPEDLAQILAARRNATAGFEDAESNAIQARAQREAQRELDETDLFRQYRDYRSDMMLGMGDQGMAFQPVGAGRGMRRAGEAEASDLGRMQFGFDRDMQGIAQQVTAARRERDRQLANLEAQEQALRDGMIRDELANFGNF